LEGHPPVKVQITIRIKRAINRAKRFLDVNKEHDNPAR